MAAPKTMKGLRKKSLRNMLRPFCTWFTSLVMRVMRVEPPMVSTSEKPRDWMWAKSARRRLDAQQTEARAAKYCATTLQPSPTSASTMSRPHRLRI